MRRQPVARLLAALLALLLLTACAAGGGEVSALPVRESLSAWPENSYTAAIPRPESGTPDYALRSPDFYAVFLRDITREEGEAYLQALEAAGFQAVRSEHEADAGGTLLTREGVTVSVSLSDGALGLYITIPEE